VDRSGLVGADGPTHHGCQDVAFLSQIPGMTVYSPADYNELRAMLRCAVDGNGPMAIRYPRGKEERTFPDWEGQAVSRLRSGEDITFVGYGVLVGELVKAAELLAEKGIKAEVLKLNRIAPLDIGCVLDSLRLTRRLLVLEDCFENGGVGQQLTSAAACAGIPLETVILKNLKGAFAPQGSVAELRSSLGLDAAGVVQAVLEELR